MIVSAVSLRNTLDAEKKLKTRHVVEVAYGVIENYHRMNQEGRMTEQEAKTAALAALRSLRYEGSEYFWINDMRPVMLMHPYKLELEGKDLSDLKDPTGKRFIMEFVDIVQKQKRGLQLLPLAQGGRQRSGTQAVLCQRVRSLGLDRGERDLSR